MPYTKPQTVILTESMFFFFEFSKLKRAHAYPILKFHFNPQPTTNQENLWRTIYSISVNHWSNRNQTVSNTKWKHRNNIEIDIKESGKAQKKENHKMSKYYFAKRFDVTKEGKSRNHTIILLSVLVLTALPIFICIMFINSISLL